MWVHEIDGPEHADLLERLERSVADTTIFDLGR
jgi:hypothetical protein